MDKTVKNILLRYITGKASKEEKTFAREWIAANQENQKSYVALYEKWHKALSTQHEWVDTDKAYERFVVETETTYEPKGNYKKVLAYAASIFIIAAAGVFLYSYSSSNKVLWHVVTVANGKTQKMTLPDGTLVFLNAGTSLKYNSDFGDKKRDVFLDGEARFDIAESKQKVPFVVNAAGFVVRDIGTIFNVKAYKEDQSFETSVLEGEISVEGKISGNDSEESKVFVSAKQLIRIKQNPPSSPEENIPGSRKTKPLQIIDFNEESQEEYNGWVNNILAFNDSSFDDVSQTLNRRFNVNISLEDEELSDFHYTGTFKNPEDVYKILTVIAQTTPIAYSSKGQDIKIKMKTN